MKSASAAAIKDLNRALTRLTEGAPAGGGAPDWQAVAEAQEAMGRKRAEDEQRAAREIQRKARAELAAQIQEHRGRKVQARRQREHERVAVQVRGGKAGYGWRALL